MRKYSGIVHIIFLTVMPFFNLYSQWNISADLNGGSISTVIADGNSLYAGTSTLGVFRSDNNGLNWIEASTGFGTSLQIRTLAAENNYVYAGTASGGIFYTTSKGAQWIQSNQGISQLNIKALLAAGDTVYAGCIFAGVFRSLNNGGNWSRFALGEGDLLNGMCMYGSYFFIGLVGGMYRSTNYGANWMISMTGITNNDVVCYTHSGNKTYCGTNGGGVFVTTNNGDTWESLSTGLLAQKINVLYNDGTNIFAGTNGRGFHFLNNSVNTWIPANQGLTDTSISSIAIKDQYIYAASSAGKIWKRLLSEIITGINSEGTNAPHKYLLYQNYPNPFNPSTVISFYIPEKSDVSLSVTDVTGKEVTKIYYGQLTEGHYTEKWNARDLPAGVYFYKLDTGKFSETKKMLYIP